MNSRVHKIKSYTNLYNFRQLSYFIGTHVNANTYDKIINSDKEDKLSFYEGYEEGCVIGLPAEPYLEKFKLNDAIQEAKKDLKELVPENILDNVQLIYDACEG